ncbi:WD40 repeat-like protein [Fomitiporia mediterranea MF3/22]|uniref:WD40 repeat-like protein n=1 Tax=Fomitiporia mediterranea (strain MF3/22) TaxID=694068 RepID=UPI0004407DDF|nr:WD40 repeat-like protein [Fomitiporia mediterranea MF3/22]EJD02007.1 WD40 repeat-like protein [Fomitiporia mediterranea MF3/22]
MSASLGRRSASRNTPVRPKLPTKHFLSTSDSDAYSLPNRTMNGEDTTRNITLNIPTPRALRISKLLGAVLNGAKSDNRSPSGSNEGNIVMVDGSFSEVLNEETVTRPPSPAPTADFSFISPPSPMSFVHILPQHVSGGLYDVFSSPTSGPEGTPNCTLFISPAKASGSMRRSPKLPKAALGRIWDALSSPARRSRTKCQVVFDGLPLDGEEGELIDEACFIAARPTIGMDIIGSLPYELSLSILAELDLSSVLACRRVCRQWKDLADDPLVWRALFYREIEERGWRIHEKKARLLIAAQQEQDNNGTRNRLLSLSSVATRNTSESHARPSLTSLAPLGFDWTHLYRTRLELDKRWAYSEPRITRIAGHTDSVYCLEFDARWLVTGSRDRAIKVWDLRTGRLRATLRGHAGSVLCLKFDKIAMARADSSDEDDQEDDGEGFMVSGSSDCTVLVWDLRSLWRASIASKTGGNPVNAGPELVKRVLRGHLGGVLDLRINKQWIVSCSKDGLIRVWDRKTLELAQTLQGHEGPVNAIGLQDGKVVSASGDGKMMLWDIATGSRIRTFEGHDRGLACIDFKGDVIVSGSNDCKIKVWRASTGTCLQTLPGHSLLVRALAYDARTGRLVSASYDKTVKVWDLRDPTTHRLMREFQTHDSHIFDVKFDVRRIVSTSHDQKVVVLDFGHDLDTSLFL